MVSTSANGSQADLLRAAGRSGPGAIAAARSPAAWPRAASPGPRRRRAGRPTSAAQRLAQQVEADPVLAQQPPARVAGARGQIQHGRQVVGQFAAVDLEPGRLVGGGELHQRLAALAGVAGGVVGQVQAAAPAEVEQLDVFGGERGRVGRRRGDARTRDSGSASAGGSSARAARSAGSAASVAVRVAQQQRGRLGRDGTGRSRVARVVTTRRSFAFGGNRPSGRPLPSQLSRLTRDWSGRPGRRSVSARLPVRAACGSSPPRSAPACRTTRRTGPPPMPGPPS